MDDQRIAPDAPDTDDDDVFQKGFARETGSGAKRGNPIVITPVYLFLFMNPFRQLNRRLPNPFSDSWLASLIEQHLSRRLPSLFPSPLIASQGRDKKKSIIVVTFSFQRKSHTESRYVE